MERSRTRTALEVLAALFTAIGIAIAMFLSLMLLFAVFAFGRTGSEAKTLRGKALVTDGDTLKIGDQPIRLLGIDAPEILQKCTRGDGAEWNCGRAAASELYKHIGGREVVCRWRQRDRYRRLIGECTADGDPNTLSYWMVSNGWALAYTDYSAVYAPAELEARASKVGVWSGAIIPPNEWRRRKRQ